MSSGKSLYPSKYAQRKYKVTVPVDFDVAIKYTTALMAIAGADGELAEAELQWYLDYQELLTVPSEAFEEYLETVPKIDWKNANIEALLKELKYDFPMNYRRALLYQAIKMSRADGIYHEKEKAAVANAAEILEIERSVLVSLESLAEIQEASDRLHLALFEMEV